MQYRETDKAIGNAYRTTYLNSIKDVIAKREAETLGARELFLEQVMQNPEQYRDKLKQMFGWPLVGDVSREFSAHEEFVAEDELCRIYRVTLDMEMGLKAYGILMLPTGVEKPRVVIAQHGGSGTPEMISAFYDDRGQNYRNFSGRILHRGMAVYAPQMLLWNPDACGEKFDRVAIDAKLKQLGGSITALELFALSVATDYLHGREDLNCDEFSMAGLSYGGFYTILHTALDTRVKRACSSCWFNDRLAYSWADWTWFNSGFTFLDAEIAALIAPRRLYIEVADKDAVFDVTGAHGQASRLKKVYEQLGKENEFSFCVFSGGHEFNPEDTGFDFIWQDL